MLETPLYYPKPGVKSGWSVRVTKSTSKALHCWFFELLKLKQVFEKVLGRKGLTFFFFLNGVTLMALFVVTEIVMGLIKQNREHFKQSKSSKPRKAQQTTPRVVLKSCCQK